VYYLDTSYIAKCYLNEPGSVEVLAWVEGKTGLCCCVHGRIELWSILCRHRREGRITKQQCRSVLAAIAADEKNHVWTWLDISREAVEAACRTVETIAGGPALRSADALHLACARQHGFRSVYSHDRTMLASAPHFGLEGIDVIEGA
jgi:hypothetical protein